MMLIQITKKRDAYGFTASNIAEDGSIVRGRYPLSVVMPEAIKDAVKVGSLWDVEGGMKTHTFENRGFDVTEYVLTAEKASFVKPNTNVMAAWLEKTIDGIGPRISSNLARNDRLLEMIEQQDRVGLIEAGVPEKSIGMLLLEYPSEAHREVIDWLAEQELPVKIAASISSIWRDKTIRVLEEDPFCLLRFNIPFTHCERIAKSFGITAADPRYKAAYTGHKIRVYCQRTSSTLMPRTNLMNGLKHVNAEAYISCAMEQEQVGFIEEQDAFQLEGNFLVEAITGKRLRDALFRAPSAGSDLALWERDISEDVILNLLNEFESGLSFTLTAEQRTAIMRACRLPVISLTGGAGTGKTTILNAIMSILERLSLGTPIYQLALSGRAAQRMFEATKRESSTITKFCMDWKKLPDSKRPDHCIVVIDEASMVDLNSMHSLLDLLPAATRFIFVGDIHQLPPVGGGLVYHELMKSDFPKVELTAVQRQAEESGIHRFATAVRNQETDIIVPQYLENPELDCTVFPSIELEHVNDLLQEHGGHKRAIVLSTVKQNANKHTASVSALNLYMQQMVGYDRPVVQWDTADGRIRYKNFDGVNFYLNDPVMVVKNDYTIGVRNGDLGVIAELYDEPTEDGSYGLVRIDRRDVEMTLDMLNLLDLGYAITTHKSQGSQWDTVILVLESSALHMLDKNLLYTGATRAQKKLIICCDEPDLIQRAVDRGSKAFTRTTNLLNHLNTDW